MPIVTKVGPMFGRDMHCFRSFAFMALESGISKCGSSRKERSMDSDTSYGKVVCW